MYSPDDTDAYDEEVGSLREWVNVGVRKSCIRVPRAGVYFLFTCSDTFAVG